jgi:hypothetical protein
MISGLSQKSYFRSASKLCLMPEGIVDTFFVSAMSAEAAALWFSTAFTA